MTVCTRPAISLVLVTPTPQTAEAKTSIALSSTRGRRRWPLLWTFCFAVATSLLLWAGIFLAFNWTATLLAGWPLVR